MLPNGLRWVPRAAVPVNGDAVTATFDFPALDGMRAAAVSAVIVFHVDADLASGGFIGVDLFFVLSGFLITGLLIREFGGTGRINFAAFYARRALRLFPALVLAVIVATCVSLSIRDRVSGSATGAATALTYTTDLLNPFVPPSVLGHTWSLAVEEQFYIFWPLVLAAILRRGRSAVVVSGGLAGVFAITTAALVPLQGHQLYFMPWTHFTELMVGAMVAGIWCAGRLSVPSWLIWPAAAFLVACALKIPGPFWRPLYRSGWLVLALASAVVIAVIATRSQNILVRMLAARPVWWVGRRSYGMYLYSVPVASVVDHIGSRRVSLQLACTYALTVALAAVSYQWIELPFLRRKRRYEIAGTGSA